MRVLFATLLLLGVVPAYGSIILSFGVDVLPSPPVAILTSASDSTIFGFAEQQSVTLTAPLNAGITSPGTWVCCSDLPGGTIAAGTTVNSYLLYASPVTDATGLDYRDFQGSITFSPGEKIVAVLIGYQAIFATDGLLGAPGTIYPPASDTTAGLERLDEVIIGPGDQAVYVNFHVTPGNLDMIRILTETPEPADFVLIGSGLVALALCRRRFARTTG
ncbi:MAG: hypothetical protein ABSF64_02430 [Bryobacteraceae bacterium]|jgi:hypothetical protein